MCSSEFLLGLLPPRGVEAPTGIFRTAGPTPEAARVTSGYLPREPLDWRLRRARGCLLYTSDAADDMQV
eukprot:10681001-Alexandrium_andersonii.AAC.1